MVLTFNMRFLLCVVAIFIFVVRESRLQLITQRPLSQYEQLQLQMANRVNGRNFLTTAFTMVEGFVGTNNSQILSFTTETLNINAVTFKNFSAITIQTPGIYLFTSSIAGFQNETTQVQLKVQDTVIKTIESANGVQTSVTAIARVNAGDSVYLQIISGRIRENNSTDLALNSFSGIELVAEINPQQTAGNPFFPAGIPTNQG